MTIFFSRISMTSIRLFLSCSHLFLMMKNQTQKVPVLLMIQRKLTILMQMQTAQPTLMKTRSLRKIQFTMSQM